MTGDRQKDLPVVLTIAGFDPSGGAGIIADIATFVSFGRRPAAAITSLTFQNSQGVFGAAHESADSLRAQILPIVEEFRIEALKTGMLPTREVVLEVVRLIAEADLPAPVVDPVLRSTSGYELIEADAVDVLIGELMPLVRVITPNIPEAEKLTGLSIRNEQDMQAAADRLCSMGARAVLIKGGHLEQGSGVRGQASRAEGRRSEVGDQRSGRGTSSTASSPAGQPARSGAVSEGPHLAIDVLNDEGRVTVFRSEWIDDAPPVSGTGCMLSAAIASCLAQGLELPESVRRAREFVARAIRNAAADRSH